MRLQHVLTGLALALCCADGVLGKQTYVRRQDNTDVATSTGDASTAASSTDNAQSSSSPTSDLSSSKADSTSEASAASSGQSSTKDGSTLTTSATQTSAASSASSEATSTAVQPSGLSVANTNSTGNGTAADALPIQPTITPAVGIAGVFLLATGVALCLIGIKHEMLFVFLSMALLASLAVTVLIIYVMPASGVSNAIQGAYLVAIVMTGLIFGAVSLVFKEVTDGLGCLLGGFCFAMWLLVLSPGGIIKSTAGRGIFIGVFCVVGFGFSFSRYTRNYALILCTAFSGAMVTILGVDCFSRAGLKEFWIYLWDLNDNEFPIGTDTYPITRGIRVEIACTIVVFIMGVMSQFKIWKIIKARRAKREAQRLQDEADRDQLESEVGKEIEDANQRDRDQWEAVYGDKRASRVHVDSGVGSSVETFSKDHGTVQEREVDGIELADVPASRRTSKRSSKPSVTVRTTSEDVRATEGNQSQVALLETDEMDEAPSHNSTNRHSYTSSATHDQGTIAESSTKDFAPGAPSVTPLPFNVPEELDAPEKVVDADNESLALPQTIDDSRSEQPAAPLKHFSLAQLNAHFGSMAPRVEEDRASSIAATADEDIDVDTVSNNRMSVVPQSARVEKAGPTLAVAPQDPKRLSHVSLARTLPEEAMEEEEDEEMLARPTTAAAEPIAPTEADHNEDASPDAAESLAPSRRSSLHAGSDAGQNASVSKGLVGQLPPKLSKIAMTYRTNEWAKHIADADMPVDDEPPRAPSPGVQVDTSVPQEAARPVDVNALQQTATTTEAAKLDRKISQASSQAPKQKKSKPSLSRNSSRQSTTPVYAFGRSSSQMSLRRQDSDVTSPQRPRLATAGMRSSSTPLLNQPLAESPIEGTADPHRVASPAEEGSSGNLMDQRNTILKRKPTSTSFNALYAASTPNVNVVAPSDAGTNPNIIHEEPDSMEEKPRPSEEMTLAQRRELMQQQQQQQQQQKRTISSPEPASRSASRLDLPSNGRYTPISPTNEAIIYDSHQPKRASTANHAQQVARLTQWRQSLQQGSSSPGVQPMEDSARQAMLESQRREEYAREKKRIERSQRESYMDAAMRSGQLHGAHRDALRRMQAKANRESRQA